MLKIAINIRNRGSHVGWAFCHVLYSLWDFLVGFQCLFTGNVQLGALLSHGTAGLTDFLYDGIEGFRHLLYGGNHSSDFILRILHVREIHTQVSLCHLMQLFAYLVQRSCDSLAEHHCYDCKNHYKNDCYRDCYRRSSCDSGQCIRLVCGNHKYVVSWGNLIACVFGHTLIVILHHVGFRTIALCKLGNQAFYHLIFYRLTHLLLGRMIEHDSLRIHYIDVRAFHSSYLYLTKQLVILTVGKGASILVHLCPFDGCGVAFCDS